MRFILNAPERLKTALHFITELPGDKVWLIDIKEYKKNRSNSQNNLYWEWLGVLSEYTGDTKDELHEKFAVKFLGITERVVKYRDQETSEIQEVLLRDPVSTTKLNTKEFSDYLGKIEMTIRTAFPELILPYPDDYKYAINAQ